MARRRPGPTAEPEDIAQTLSRRLTAAARAEKRLGYGPLSAELGLPSPRVQALAALLEAGMAADAEAGRPFLAAVMRARLRALPARGFFEAARALGRYDGPDEGPEAEAFHGAELARLRAALSDAEGA
ncbi:MAG: hypothetical protein AAF763_13450 [Pseudomonadota bacterium]